MAALDAYKERSKEVRRYLGAIRILEAQAAPRRVWRSMAITTGRATAFIMIYNCIEHSLREAFVALRQDMKQHAAFGDLRDFWQAEIFSVHFQERLAQGGSKHEVLLKDMVAFMPGKTDWRGADARLPFSGNIDQDRVLRLVRDIGATWRPPKKSLGGADLQLVRQVRNELAHGEESFDVVGGSYTTSDIATKFDRICSFMHSFLNYIERYRASRRYRR